jgi:methyl-accepting chemotaxis protein
MRTPRPTTFLTNLTIGKRLIALTAALGAVCVILVMVSFSSFSSITSSKSQAVDSSAQLTVVHDAYEAWLTQDDQSNMYVAIALLSDPSDQGLLNTTWRQVLQGEATARQAIAQIAHYPSSPELVTAVHQLSTDFAAYSVFTAQVRSDVLSGEISEAVQAMTIGNLKSSNGTQAAFNKIKPLVQQSFNSHNNSISSSVSSGRTLLLTIAIVALLLAGGLSFLIIRSITRPLGKLTEAAGRFALGDVEVDLDASGRDEISSVARSFNDAITAQKQLAATFAEFADGHIGVQLEPRSDRDALSHAFISMQRKLAATIAEISQSSEMVASASSEMAVTSEETGRAVQEIAGAMNRVANGAEQQVRALEQARAAFSELNDATRLSADTASETATAAVEARDLARNGVSAAEQASTAMRAVRDSSVETTAAIKALGAKSDQIGGIVATITGIASQTNLLALNAAIEAARAGEQGRGFAVVAEEVRHLAEESEQAAASIRELIEEIQKETQRTVQAVEAGAAQTEGGVHTVEQARDAFVQIGDSVDDVTERVEQIAAAIRQIETSGEQMRDTLLLVAQVAESSSASSEEVSASTEQTSASTEEIAASAQQLAATADELEKLVGQFALS